MFKINTFVFFDIETTGIPRYESPPTKITELAFVACSRKHLLATVKNKLPRVLQKILLPIQPLKCILPETTKITGNKDQQIKFDGHFEYKFSFLLSKGLDNFLLEHVAKFDGDTVALMNCFLNRLEKPVCLVAHNGNNFDYPLLSEHLKRIVSIFLKI